MVCFTCIKSSLKWLIVSIISLKKYLFLTGILDQGEGVLIIFEDTPVNKTYEAALETIQSLGKVVDALYQKATKLS